MSRGLLKDISISELKSMRESGMTNMDIANSLGVGYQTIYRLLGRQPKGVRGSYTFPEARGEQDDKEEFEEAALAVENREIKLAGLFASYRYHVREKTFDIITEGDNTAITMSVDDIETFVKELSAIKRKAAEQCVGVEAW